MTQNQIAYWNLQEQKRSNRVKEQETNRSNLEQERLKADIQNAQKTNLGFQNAKYATGAFGDIGKVINDSRSVSANKFGSILKLVPTALKLIGG